MLIRIYVHYDRPAKYSFKANVSPNPPELKCVFFIKFKL